MDRETHNSDVSAVICLSLYTVQTKGRRATLTTPPLQWPYPGRPGCVTFSFHIPDNAPGSLVISTVLTSHDRVQVQHVWKAASIRFKDDAFARNPFLSAQLPVTLTSNIGERNLRVSTGL